MAGTARWKLWLWSVAAILGLKVLVHDELITGILSPEYRKHAHEIRWLLISHALSGIIALLTGPLLFSSRFRRTHIDWHRRFGRLYVYCSLIAAPLGASIAVKGLDPFTFAITTFAAAWMLATAVAFRCAIRRDLVSHREWMVRSYSIAFIFVLDRVPLPLEMEPPIHACFLLILVLLGFVIPQVVFTFQKRA